ncbi:YcaO-related McrA-glycine thioamidation protein [Methanobacterium aggregans]|uniref:YcaO-related McrA-glycine thioamidation protein n=1 Tax=Methanobacterium aggregans TaxID=1615586 RepID=UPI00320CE924
MFQEVPIKYFGCTHRSIAPEATIKNVEGKLKAAGVTRVAEITHLDRVGVPVYSAIRPMAADGAVSIYAGKGATKTQAKASAMMESFERYSAEIHDSDREKIISGVFEEVDNALDPRSLILPNTQFNPEESRLEWIKARDLKDEREYMVPANAVYHPYNLQDSLKLFKSNTNGLASGNRIEEAVFHGMMEVVERDAWSIFEAHRSSKPEIDCENTENPLIKDLLMKFRDAGINVKLMDLTADIKISTIAAVSDDPVLKDPALLTLGVGTHLDPEIAAIRALTEVAQSRATQIHGTREDTVRAVFMRKAGYERMKRINKHWFGDSEETINLSEIKNRSGSSFREDISMAMKILRKCGFNDVLYSDLTRSNIEIPVVRVIIPGLEVYSVDMDRAGKRLA